MNRIDPFRESAFVSGRQSKKFRENLAQSSDYHCSSVRTVKFKLDCSKAKSLPSFDDYRAVYDAIEGVEKGCLTYFLVTLISNGFRIFASAPEAQAYASSEIFRDCEFKMAVKKAFGIELGKFTPTNIVLRFQKLPRSSNGRDISFSASVISEEYRKFFFNKKKLSKKIEDFFEDVSQALAVQFSSWRELKDNLPQAAQMFDTVLKKYGVFPSLQKMVEASSNSLPDGSTVAFNARASTIDAGVEPNIYVAVASVLREFRWGGSLDPAGFVQERITTSNGNGLAWLFSKGLKIFAETPVVSSEGASLCSMFSVPESRSHLLMRIQEAALPLIDKKIPFRNSMKPLSFGDFRSSFAGHLDSWVANYVDRLLELEKYFSHLPTTLEIPSCFEKKNRDFVADAGLDRTEFAAIAASFAGVREGAHESLNALLGRADYLPADREIKNIEAFTEAVNRFNAYRKFLVNRAEIASRDKTSYWNNLLEEIPSEWINQAETKIPKLNGIGGGVPSEEELLQQYLQDFVFLKVAQARTFSLVMSWGCQQDAFADIFEVLRERVCRELAGCPNQELIPEEQAVRYFLNEIALAVRYCNDEAAKTVKRWFRARSIFANPKDFNSYFYNRKGCLYKSVYSSKRECPYDINPAVFHNEHKIWEDFDRLMGGLLLKYVLISEEQSTILELENLWMMFQLRSIRKNIPRNVASIRLPDTYKDGLGKLMGVRYEQDTIPPTSFIKEFNMYATLLKGLGTQLRRNRFFLRTKFCWQKNNSLLYRPKLDKSWRIPERYRKAANWQEIFASGILVMNEDGSVNVARTFDRLHALNDSELSKFSLLLQQLPHEWGYENPFVARNKKASIKILELRKIGSKGMQLRGRLISDHSFFRLIGPSTQKTQLDRMLVDPKKTTIGDMTLLVDEAFNQSIVRSHIKLEAEEPMLSLAIPLTIAGRPKDTEQEKPSFTHLIGIDQGEAGIAYAVFKLDDAGNAEAQAVTTGTIRIPSIRRLINGVKVFRKEKQRTEKFNQRFSSTMFTMRKNVVGDVCHAIVGLMEAFNAFPVLEREVRNLESGSRQLSMVYKAVNAHFLRPEVDAHNAMRKQLWFSAGAWTMPEFIQHWDDMKNPSKESDDGRLSQTQLHVWPGAAVPAHYTSRICSCCGRNVSALIRKAKTDDAYEIIHVNKDGEAEIYGETVKLYVSDKEHDGKYYRQRNERVPLTTPLPECDLTLKEFERLVKRNLRRPPTSLQSKDTSQSRYFCVFKGCAMHNVEQHADVNAAINIGRRFLAHLSKTDSKE